MKLLSLEEKERDGFWRKIGAMYPRLADPQPNLILYTGTDRGTSAV